MTAYAEVSQQLADLDAVRTDLREVVTETMQPERLSLWLRGQAH